MTRKVSATFSLFFTRSTSDGIELTNHIPSVMLTDVVMLTVGVGPQ